MKDRKAVFSWVVGVRQPLIAIQGKKCAFHVCYLLFEAVIYESRVCQLYIGKPVFNAYKIVQKDATGAGDCFDGAFLAGISQNKDLDTACRWASAAGALNAAAFGPMEGDISIETVEKMIEG